MIPQSGNIQSPAATTGHTLMTVEECMTGRQPAVVPDSLSRRFIEKAVQVDMYNCWTCSSCDLECPVNIATGRLRPQKIIRLANYGLKDELVAHPEIWYCLTCRRCNSVCPNRVKPATLIEYLRKSALEDRIISDRALHSYRDLFTRFQNIRWHAVAECLRGRSSEINEKTCHTWLEKPLSNSVDTIAYKNLFRGSDSFKSSVANAGANACFTCCECSNTCPVFCPGGVFDPRWIFRMANLGLTEMLLKSPVIWLCLDCHRCTDTCSQLVRGHDLIRDLRFLALKEGHINSDFPLNWHNLQKQIYPFFLKEVDKVCKPN